LPNDEEARKPMASKHDPEMQDEYDFSNGIRGKYATRYREGTNLVKLDDDVASMFPDERSVNEALRAPVDVIHQHDKRHA
jgi:hypothetical protein